MSINLYNKKILVLFFLLIFVMSSVLTFSQTKEDLVQISLKISSFENLSSEEKSDLQEDILKMVFFFDLDAEVVNQKLDNAQISASIDKDNIILEFASLLNISLEELDQVYDDIGDYEDDDNDLDDDLDDNGDDDDDNDMDDDLDDNGDDDDDN